MNGKDNATGATLSCMYMYLTRYRYTCTCTIGHMIPESAKVQSYSNISLYYMICICGKMGGLCRDGHISWFGMGDLSQMVKGLTIFVLSGNLHGTIKHGCPFMYNQLHFG